MKAHVLITSNETFPVCRDRLFWGIGTPDCPSVFDEWVNPANSRKPYLKMLVDMMGIAVGDLIFLYERQVGFHGIYKAASTPFFDTASVGNQAGFSVGRQWPLRITLECVYYFPKPVREDLLFSNARYENVFWIWAYRKSQGARGCNTITPEAAETLTELLVKVNGEDRDYDGFDPYRPQDFNSIRFPIKTRGPKVALEGFLTGFVLQHLQGRQALEHIFGPKRDIEWYANNVPYHIAQKNIDILVFHKNFRYTPVPLRYKYSVVELKKDVARPGAVSQLIRYCQWVGGRLANGEVEMVQPILLAHDFADEGIARARSADFNDRDILLCKYRTEGDTIRLERLDL
jgi:hypothetical protein